MITKNEAITLFNDWGAQRIPFLFIIDYEMRAIRSFRLDRPLPGNVMYNFQGISSVSESTIKQPKSFNFKKYPLAFIDYQHAFNKIQRQIKAGNSFLTNLTFPTPVEITLTLRQIFELSRAPYKILIDGEFVCFSPESFVTIRDGIITTYPMKGTIQASVNRAEESILEDRKETAEHNTIVDLLRNDLSMVSKEVTVKRFRYIDKIITHEGEMLQVSSEISGKLPSDYNRHFGEILFALLPAGSVTGAPKTKTTQLIREVEQSDRGYYTGICGIFDGRNVDSAVMIRFIEISEGKMRFRSGGGITFLSIARNEYQELIDKVYVPIA